MVTKDMTIMEAVNMNEGIVEVLMSMGMHCIGCAMAHGETLGEAAEVHGIDPDALINELNKYLASAK